MGYPIDVTDIIDVPCSIWAVETAELPTGVMGAPNKITLDADYEPDVATYTSKLFLGTTEGATQFSRKLEIKKIKCNEQKSPIKTFTGAGGCEVSFTSQMPFAATIRTLLHGNTNYSEVISGTTYKGAYGFNTTVVDDYGLVFIATDGSMVGILFKISLEGDWNLPMQDGEYAKSQFTITGLADASRGTGHQDYHVYRTSS